MIFPEAAADRRLHHCPIDVGDDEGGRGRPSWWVTRPIYGHGMLCSFVAKFDGHQRSAKGVLVRRRDTRGDGVSVMRRGLPDGKSSKDSVEVLAYGVSP